MEWGGVGGVWFQLIMRACYLAIPKKNPGLLLAPGVTSKQQELERQCRPHSPRFNVKATDGAKQLKPTLHFLLQQRRMSDEDRTNRVLLDGTHLLGQLFVLAGGLIWELLGNGFGWRVSGGVRSYRLVLDHRSLLIVLRGKRRCALIIADAMSSHHVMKRLDAHCILKEQRVTESAALPPGKSALHLCNHHTNTIMFTISATTYSEANKTRIVLGIASVRLLLAH
eukprot:3818399-Amphidinium_carterae.3